MSHDEGTPTDGSVADDSSDPTPVSESSSGGIKSVAASALTRTRFIGNDLQLDWRAATTGAKVLMVTGAAAIAYCGVRGVTAVASLRGRSATTVVDRLRSWRR